MKRGANKTGEESGAQGVQVTISQLKRCNQAQSEVIAVLEDYIRTSAGVGLEDDPEFCGYGAGYVVEIDYLQTRLGKLESVISSFEKYEKIAAASLGLGIGIQSE